MHDNWEPLIGQYLSGIRLCDEVRVDVVREVATHFEQLYEDARSQGAGDSEARQYALDSVRDWSRFARDVQSAKETFMTTTPFRRRVILPGLVAMVFSAIPLWITSLLHHQGAQYIFVSVGDPRNYFTFNIPWLIALPIAGFAGAWLSRRAAGNSLQRALAAVFPSVALAVFLLGMLLIVMPLATIVRIMMGVGPHLSPDDFSISVWAFRLTTLFMPWVISPALSSLLGAIPVLWLRPPRDEHEPASPAHA